MFEHKIGLICAVFLSLGGNVLALTGPAVSGKAIDIIGKGKGNVDFDKIYVLDNGEVKEQGTHHELIKQNGIYAKMYMTQAENYQTKAGEKNGCAKK